MEDAPNPSEGLPLLARLYREKRSGLVALGSSEGRLLLHLRDGMITALGPVEAPPAPALPGPDDSAQIRLEQILVEVGVRRAAPKPQPPPPVPTVADLRERVLEELASGAAGATFAEDAPPPPEMAEVAGATEAFVLEAVRRLRSADAVRAQLGDLDRRLVCTAALAEERTLTLLEGYLLSRIDGTASAWQVLQLVPLEPEDAERSLLGLLLTGRVEWRPAPAPRAAPRPEVAPPPAPEAFPAGDVSTDEPPAPREEPTAEPPPPDAELDRDRLEMRREILEIFRSLPLKNHFEVLGVEPGCTDAEVKRAYSALARQFHPDVHRDPRLEDLSDVLEAIFIRVGEAWEVLGDAKSRANYESRFGAVRHLRQAAPGAPGAPSPAATAAAPVPPLAKGIASPSSADYVTSEETLLQAQIFLLQAKYWEAITVLEAALPQMEPPRHQNRGRILLARAYAKNPNWLRKAEEQLQDVLRTDPQHVEAHYQLGLLYKAQGLTTRAQGMFRRVIELKPDHREALAELAAAGAAGSGGLLKRLFGRGKAS
ncbi:MAG TPA: DnaJ domain-containing protein [Vicinamibacteria bacterium]|nr:DnaJ domain-containing protein [Vicinamibacteria bacterium]